MLPVQEYLRSGKSLEDLKTEYAINVAAHPELPLVSLKYNQLDSPKTNPIVRSCRGTILELDSWDAVGISFRRFFNVGEDLENYKNFDWTDFSCMTKEDGSLMILYYYKGSWHVNTSGSFGLFECNKSGKTWRQLFWETSQIDPTKLNPEYSYVFEMWTPHNIVVRTYEKPIVFLLSAFHVESQQEVSLEEADQFAVEINVPRPETHAFSCYDEIVDFLLHKQSVDKTYEGVILRDKDNRYKWKTETYLAAHRLLGNGTVTHPKNLVPLVLNGEIDEIVATLHWDWLKPLAIEVSERLTNEYEALRGVWQANYQEPDQKTFALAVGKVRFASLLFTLRKEKGQDQTEADLKRLWRTSSDMIIRRLYG